MKLTTKTTVLTLITSIGLTLMPTARAAHATNFLNALQTEVTNRIANTNLPAAQQRALASANKSLSRDTKTLATDLIALSTAANALNKQFTNDSTLAALEDDALDAYSDEAHAQLDNAELHIGTNTISKGLSNQLAKIRIALTNADAITNGVPAKAKALANVFNRLRNPVAKILQQYPTIPFEAPTSVGGLMLRENAVVNEQTIYDFNFDSVTTFRDYHADDPEELGTWTYQRTSATTGILSLSPNFPPGNSGPHTMNLTFTTSRSGTFTGQTIGTAARPAENLTGTFTLDE
jgi:hypothetical protein